jgi:hypothetical protein
MPPKEKKTLGDNLYAKVKDGVQYMPQIHCPLIIDLFNSGKGISEFCIQVGISRQKFVGWQMMCDLFKESVLIGKEVGSVAWLREGTDNKFTKDFSVKLWEAFGRKNFGSLDKVSLFVSPKASPLVQYEQIMEQAATGDFTSAEIKQIMESINIGLRAFEVGELQREIDELKEGLKHMEERELEHQIATSHPSQGNKASLDS